MQQKNSRKVAVVHVHGCFFREFVGVMGVSFPWRTPRGDATSLPLSYETVFGHAWRYQLRAEGVTDIWAFSETEDESRARLLKWALSFTSADTPWVLCDYGMQGRRVIDTSVRACKRLNVRDWVTGTQLDTVTQELVNKSGIRADIYTLRMSRFELLRYVPGGKFRSHVDGRQGPTHIGTILCVVPTLDTRGGALATSSRVIGKNSDAYVAFIPLEVAHAVGTLTEGVRYVLKASVFAKTRRGQTLQTVHYRED